MNILKWLFQPDRIIEGKTYYDPKINRFFQLRKILKYSYLCGDYCNFFEDSKTTILTMEVSGKILKRSCLVLAIDKCPYAELDKIVNAWQVKQIS